MIIDNSQLPWNWYAIGRNPNLTIDFLVQFLENKEWIAEFVFKDKVLMEDKRMFVSRELCRLSLLSLMDEDCEQGVVNSDNAVDVVLHNEHLVYHMRQFL